VGCGEAEIQGVAPESAGGPETRNSAPRIRHVLAPVKPGLRSMGTGAPV
jgi:hypothetical protein